MCFPALAAALPYIAGGLGVASVGVQYAGARQQAKTQARYQAQAASAERQRFAQEQTSLRMRQAQEQEAVGRELEQVSRKSQQALARARVSAGEAGVAGASVQALMDDYTRQEAGYRAALLRQQELGAVATGMGLEQAGFATQQRQIGINRPISRPSGLAAGLGALSAGLSGYATGLDIAGRMPGAGAGGSGPFNVIQTGDAPMPGLAGSRYMYSVSPN
tara:strand:+ start:1284 stop:1940 length:657 start_codon:yes stop_codon:yes gene_type:complete